MVPWFPSAVQGLVPVHIQSVGRSHVLVIFLPGVVVFHIGVKVAQHQYARPHPREGHITYYQDNITSFRREIYVAWVIVIFIDRFWVLIHNHSTTVCLECTCTISLASMYLSNLFKSRLPAHSSPFTTDVACNKYIAIFQAKLGNLPMCSLCQLSHRHILSPLSLLEYDTAQKSQCQFELS